MNSKYLVAAACIEFLGVTMGRQEPVLLRLRVEEGTKDHYAFTASNSNVATLPNGQTRDSKTEYTQDLHITYGRTNLRGETELTFEAKNFRATSSVPVNGPGDFKFTGKSSNRFELSDLKAVDNDPRHEMLVSTMTQTWRLFSLPEKAVKVGDTWDRKYSAQTAVGKIEKDLVMTYERDETQDGFNLVVVTTKGDLPIDADLSASRGARPGTITAKGTMNLSMIIKFDKATGRLFSSESTMTSNMSIGNASGESSTVLGTAQNSMRLVVPKK
jgi:hypothetical protein